MTGALYTGYCFPGDPNVIRETGRILRDAYQSTASYIYSVFRTRQQ